MQSEKPAVKRKLNPEIDSDFDDVEVKELRVKVKFGHTVEIDTVIPKTWRLPLWTLSMAIITTVLWAFAA